jgi:2-methylfumaryl-CoA isomerase
MFSRMRDEVGPPGQPLHGMRVIEISGYVATPLAGMTLAQLGADVIRLEPLGGGPDRTRWPLAEGGTSLYWSGLNKGKRAVEVDFGSARGRHLVADLVVGGGPRGGIVVSNSERYRELAFETLRERRPDLIHVLLTGRRDGGTAVDYTVQASTGFPMITGPEESASPVNHLLPAWDLAAGLYLATGLLAAERHRMLTGEGQQVRLALEDVAMATAGNLGYLTEAQVADASRGSCGNYVYGTFGRDFVTSDGTRLMLVVLTARHWHQLLEATGLADVVAALAEALDADLDEESERWRHRKVLAGLLEDWFGRHTHAEAKAALGRTRVLWSTYRTFSDLAADPALRDNPLLSELDQPGVGPHLAPGSPLVMSGAQSTPRPAPAVGEHTDEVLSSELGMSAEDLRRLHESGVLGPPRTAQALVGAEGRR